MCVCLACGVVSLGDNGIGAEGAAAIGAGLVHVPSLTTLQYVRTRRLFWVEGGSVTGLCAWVWYCGCVYSLESSARVTVSEGGLFAEVQ